MTSEADRVSRLLEAASWRHGPASLHYDRLELAEDAVTLDAVMPAKKVK